MLILKRINVLQENILSTINGYTNIDELQTTTNKLLAIDLNLNAEISVIYTYTTVSYPLNPNPAMKKNI